MGAVTLIILYVMAHYLAGLDNLTKVLAEARWSMLGIAVLALVVNITLAAKRLSMIVGTMGYRLPYVRSLDAILATWPLALVTPSRASDLLRAVAIRDLVPVMEGSGGVIAEKLIDVQSLCLLALGGALATGLWPWAALAASLLIAEWCFALLLLLRPGRLLALPLIRRFKDKLERILRAFTCLRDEPWAFVRISLVSLLAWTVAIGLVQALLALFSAGVAPLQTLALWPLALFVGMLPLTVAGMGTRDVAFLSFLGATGTVDAAPVLAATFSYAVVGAWFPAAVGLPFMVRQMRKI